MKFESALKAMRSGQDVRMSYQKGFYFMRPVRNKSNGKMDMRIYYQRSGEFTQRVTQMNVRFLTMADWEIVEDDKS